MKTFALTGALLISTAAETLAQVADTNYPNSGNASSLPAPTSYAIVQRDANSQVWQSVDYEILPSGVTVPHVHKFTELATGLNHIVNGQWAPSTEKIDISPDGNSATATNGQHQVYFPGNIYSGVIKLVTPDGKTLRSQPIGLGYDDGSNSVLIAVLTNSTGAILPSGNQVIYQNAFTGFNADLLYTYTKAGFEQDVVIRTEPPTPESFGLNPATAKLQVLTEFFNPSQPTTTTTTLPAQAGILLTDQALDFGVMKIGMGRAFTIGDNASAANVLVGKQWVQVGGRQILVEEVPVEAVAAELGTLPLSPGVSTKTGTAVHLVASRQWQLPPPHLTRAGEAGQFKRMAAGTSPKQGLVLDYQILNGSQTNFTFNGDTTYYISGAVNLYGKTNILEGGVVLKYSDSSSPMVNISGSLVCQNGSYRPAVFTAMDDNSIGETISGSSGNPSTINSATYLYLPSNTTQTNDYHYLRMSYAGLGISNQGTNIVRVWDSQFLHCGTAVATGGNIQLRNVLIAQGQYCLYANSTRKVSAENLTADQCSSFFVFSTFASLTNSILTAVTNTNGISVLVSSKVLTHNSGIYQTVGAGNYYLANNSPYRNAGATNIDSTLLASLKTKTTYPPIVFANAAVAGNFVFSPQVPRDTNAAPALGYHYDPIDYAVSGVSLNNAIVAVYPGTVIAAFGTSNNASGLNLGTGTEFLCKGLATKWNRIVAYNTVQEQSGTTWQEPTNGLVTALNDDASSTFNCRFTDWSVPAQDEAFLVVTNNNSQTSVSLRDCQFHGGSITLATTYFDPDVNNCLFDRVNFSVIGASVFSFQNNLCWHGTFNFAPNNDEAVVQNNLFDQTVIPDNSSAYGTYIGGYNACVTNCDQLQPVSTNDLVLTNPPVYRVGPLGNYYQPTNSPLINAGSTNADQLGLYDYTVVTNLVSGQEIKETNSIVDIGYHYVAVDSNGVPLTTYTNGLPDYLVTSSTDPIADWWEFVYFGNLDQATNGDYDNDGTNNLTEYQNGTDPNKISFSFSFPNQYVSTNIVTAVVTILGGVPSSIAVLVDSTNFASATWTNYTPNITVNLGSTQGPHDVWIGLRGLPANAYQTWEDTTLVLDSNSPSITITNPANGISLNASRVNVSGTFTAASLHQITVNDIVAFVNGTNFEALNVPLAAGTNVITATVEDLTGVTNAFSVSVVGITNSGGSMNSPVQLQATPVAGFAPLPVTFSVQTNMPGTIQQVSYDFNGDDIADMVTNNLLPLTYIYATNGEYFPVVTIQTTAGRFSSVGGWNAVALDPSNQPVQINVQAALTQTIFISSINDPVDLKWTGTNLFVLSGSSGTIAVFDTNGSPVGTPFSIGAASSGFDVDANGNVYVAVTASNQVWKFNPSGGSFTADPSFGNDGFIGTTNGVSGTTNGAFNAPFDVAVSPDGGTISVSDSGNNRIQQFDSNGNFLDSFGTNGTDVGQFNTPKGLTYDSIGNLYIVDSGNDRVVLARNSVVLGTSGTNGTALGQFDGPVNISIDERGVYVADTDNDRIQVFELLANGVYSFAASGIRFGFSTNFSGPFAVAAVDNLTNEIFYVADTGNNRVLLCRIASDDPTQSWGNMTNRIAAGDISGAISSFCSDSSEGYRQAFLDIGTANAISDVNQIGPLTPVFIKNDTAEYYFEQTIDGHLLLFPVEFVKENGVWKILEF